MARHLAQFNRAVLAVPLDDPTLVPFLMAIGPVLEEAAAAPGFVARQQFLGPFTQPNPFPDNELATISVWTGIDELRAYTYSGGHRDVLRRRAEWFLRETGPNMVLWWVPEGHVPEPDEALERLAHLAADGPTAGAFSFSKPFEAPIDG